MKIRLIDSGSKKLLFNENVPQVGLAYIAAILERSGHEVSYVDATLMGPAATEQFLQQECDIYGLSATSFTARDAATMARRIKEYHRNAVVVLGGPHVSIAETSVLDCDCIDYAVMGEGELVMEELVGVLNEDRMVSTERLSQIKGLLFRDGERRVCNPRGARIDNLDELPFPAYHLFPMERYGMYPVLTSRGCPFGCSFCAIKAIWGTQWKFRSPENIVEEIRRGLEDFNWAGKPFNIIDDSFNVIPERVMAFCDALQANGLKVPWFASGFRADRVSYKLALRMRESGCMGVSIGIESANDEVLQNMGKKETIADCIAGCAALKRAGLPVQAQFMIGNPGDTLTTFKESLDFARKHRFAQATFYLALPYPKTELWDYVVRNGKFLQEDYTNFHHFSNEPVFETPEFSAEERRMAYRLGRQLTVRSKLRHDIKTKLARIKRLDFADLSLARIAKASARLCKSLLDICLNRDEKV